MKWITRERPKIDIRDDYELLEKAMLIYDALYSWARYVQDEKHTWDPTLVIKKA